MYTKPGPWTLSLRGTACAICGQRATRLTVFALERVITHEEEHWPPCRLSNVPASSTVDQVGPVRAAA